MHEYESIFILDPEVEDAQVDVELGKIKDVVSAGSGEIIEVQKWGRRKLAYDIKKRREGIYTLVRFTGGGGVLSELERRYRLNESLLRHLTVRYEAPPAGAIPAEGEETHGAGEHGGPPRYGAPSTRPAVATAPASSAPAPVPSPPAPVPSAPSPTDSHAEPAAPGGAEAVDESGGDPAQE